MFFHAFYDHKQSFRYCWFLWMLVCTCPGGGSLDFEPVVGQWFWNFWGKKTI